MALSKDNIINEIENMAIYSLDKEIIEKLLDLSPNIFATVVENVILGELYWSDFEDILGNTNYQDIVTDILEKQKNLKEELKNLNSDRANPDSGRAIVNYLTTNVGIPESVVVLDDENKVIESETSLVNDIYNKELSILKGEVLYDLTRVNARDTDLALLVKLKLYELLINSPNVVTSSKDISKLQEAITMDDIFLFIDSYTIPANIKYQVLTESDRDFMAKNDISEETMKKFKSLEFILRRADYVETVRNAEASNVD